MVSLTSCVMAGERLNENIENIAPPSGLLEV
jgi:hypothetical protein